MKNCSIDNCKFPVFGTDKKTKKGYCKYHQSYRTDIKKNIPKSTLKERNEKLLRNKVDFDPLQWGFKSELLLFYSLWKDSNKKSQISNRDLKYLEGLQTWINCFAHVLCKNKFPLFRYNPENIIICHPFEHYLIDQGTIKDKVDYIEYYNDANFNIFYNKYQQLKEIYPKI